MQHTEQAPAEARDSGGPATAGTVKCLVWDLDNTLWRGTLAEGDEPEVRPGVREIIRELDARGILQSIASRNDHNMAMEKLKHFGLAEYFLYPQIHWGSKADSIRRISESLNLNPKSFAFVDDQEFERMEVGFHFPSVLCVDALELEGIPDRPEFRPRFITEDSALRRQMYLDDERRNRLQTEFTGPEEEFLTTLDMEFSIATAREEDLKRAEELTVRTHQLNSTGYSYSYEELDAFRKSAAHKLFITSLSDRFGSYGKIGLALVECAETEWSLKLLLMSCRVMNRGVGSVLMGHIIRLAHQAGVRLFAEFVPNEVNRTMYVTYKFAGFRETGDSRGKTVLLENDLKIVPSNPSYMKVSAEA